MAQSLRECRENRLGGTKAGLNEVKSPLGETNLPFCAHEAQRKKG
jgi:hypothetical protein